MGLPSSPKEPGSTLAAFLVFGDRLKGSSPEYIWHSKLPRRLLQSLIPASPPRTGGSFREGKKGPIHVPMCYDLWHEVGKPDQAPWSWSAARQNFTRPHLFPPAAGKRKSQQMGAQVSTYSGHRLHERPLSFILAGRRLEVREILERGYAPGSLFFKVRAEDDGVYLLRYHEAADFWEVSIGAPGGRAGS